MSRESPDQPKALPLNSNQDSSHNLTPRVIFICLGIFCGLLFLAIFSLCYNHDFGFGEAMRLIRENTFLIHYNNFNEYPAGKIGGENILSALYKITLVVLTITVFIVLFFINPFRHKERQIPFTHVITIGWIAVFFLYTGFQQLHRFDALQSEEEQFKGKDLNQRIYSIIGPTYGFALHCQKRLSRPLEVEIISGVNKFKDPHMTHMRNLAYFLYPKVPLRYEAEYTGPEHGVLLFYKQDIMATIPQNYDVVCNSEDLNYILAIKKDVFADYVN